MIFGKRVADPQRFGVVEVDGKGFPLSLEEKPLRPRSNIAVTGLYFFDHRVASIAHEIVPSKRGELEITSVLKRYLEESNLSLKILERGCAWLDTGTFDSLLEAASLVHTLQKHQGTMIACLEEIACQQGWISEESLLKLAEEMTHSAYGEYLLHLSNKG